MSRKGVLFTQFNYRLENKTYTAAISQLLNEKAVNTIFITDDAGASIIKEQPFLKIISYAKQNGHAVKPVAGAVKIKSAKPISLNPVLSVRRSLSRIKQDFKKISKLKDYRKKLENFVESNKSDLISISAIEP